MIPRRQAVQFPPLEGVWGAAASGHVVVGIDPSLVATGLCVAVGGVEVETVLLETTPADLRPVRLLQLREQVRKRLDGLLAVHGAVLVAMETEIWMRNPTQSKETSAVQAILQLVLYEAEGPAARASGPTALRSLRYLAVNPSYVKKWLGAKEKAQVLLQVYKRYRREFHDHNLADAYTLALIGASLLDYEGGRTWPEWTKPQLEVLDKLRASGFPWEAPPRRRQGYNKADKRASRDG